jgi:hypothetical protein
MVSRQLAGFLVLQLVLGGIAAGQFRQDPGSHYLEIRLPPQVRSETVFIRYMRDGDEVGGSVEALPGVNSYLIETTRAGRPATRIKALIYVPRCALRTLDLPVSGLGNQHFEFECQALPDIWITGILNPPGHLSGSDVTLHVTYAARWAQPFMHPAEALFTTIPVGAHATASPDGRFRLSVPDLSRDPLAGAPDHPGELQLWASEKTTGNPLAELVPTGVPALKAKTGGLKIQTQYPPEIVFTPCAPNGKLARDNSGFAVRSGTVLPGTPDPCDR